MGGQVRTGALVGDVLAHEQVPLIEREVTPDLVADELGEAVPVQVCRGDARRRDPGEETPFLVIVVRVEAAGPEVDGVLDRP